MRFRYVGPAELVVAGAPGGHRVGSVGDFGCWVAARSAAELAEPFTFVVDVDGWLLLAPRRSEHVACAGGDPVLGAGEVGFAYEAGRWVVTEVSNQSTGYCPDVGSWAAVARAFDRAGLARPDGFTHAVVFRRCPGCRELNIVRENDFVCVFCGGDLPAEWNVDSQS
jgi:hypothetical protein